MEHIPINPYNLRRGQYNIRPYSTGQVRLQDGGELAGLRGPPAAPLRRQPQHGGGGGRHHQGDRQAGHHPSLIPQSSSCMVNGLDHGLRSALHWAALGGRARVAARLLARGAKPDLVDEGGATAPHLATLSGDPDTVGGGRWGPHVWPGAAVRVWRPRGHSGPGGQDSPHVGRSTQSDLPVPACPHLLQLAGRAAVRCWTA